jgi:hypothetical protein
LLQDLGFFTLPAPSLDRPQERRRNIVATVTLKWINCKFLFGNCRFLNALLLVDRWLAFR